MFSIEFRAADCPTSSRSGAPAYDLITAHGFMDIVPVATTVSVFRWLAHGGMLYASSTTTATLRSFRSIAIRHSKPRCSPNTTRRWSAAACVVKPRGVPVRVDDFTLPLRRRLWRGRVRRSDWDITPREGRYRDRDADVLRTLLMWIRSESEGRPAIEWRRSLAGTPTPRPTRKR